MLKQRVKKADVEPKESFAVPESKIVRKKTPQKTARKKAVAKKLLSIKKKPPTAKIVTKSENKRKSKNVLVKNDDAVVTIPTTASLRLLEKVNLYKLWYQETLPLRVTSSARFFGYLFIGLGTLFAVSGHMMNSNLTPGVAALICSAGICEEVADDLLPSGAPYITFLNTIPQEIKSNIDFSIKVDNTDNFRLILTNIQTGSKSDLKYITQTEAVNYQYLIATAKLLPGDYRIEAIADAGDTEYVFAGPTFSYKPEERHFKPVEVVEADIDLEIDEDGQSTSSTDITSTSTTTLSNDVSITSTSSSPNDRLPVSLTLEKSTDASYLVITTGDFLPQRVNVYSRIDQSRPEIYLGQAQLVQNQWFFSLSAISLPLVPQQLFASFDVDGLTKRTKAVFLPYLQEGIQTFDISEDFLIRQKKVDLTLQSLGVPNESRKLYYTSSASVLRQENESQFIGERLIAEIDDILQTEASVLDTYFFHYGLTYLGGQSYLVNLAKQELDNYTKIIASTIAQNNNDNTLAPAIETILQTRFSKLTEMIKPLEDKLVTQTNTLIKQDSDSDGITDFDEITNLFTDPTSPDTDQDGVIDGVEIILLTDPLSADAQAFPQLIQNQPTVASEEVLSVIKSKPMVFETNTKLPKQTQYSIEGRGIPNTFVYLLDRTSNNVGVIKTNASGEFFYTIEQTAIQGLSTIQAAMIGSTGEIVSLSAIYDYTKQSNQLMAAVSNIFLGDQEFTSRLTSFNILIGSVSLVALGFILLFLAQGIIMRRKSVVLKDLNFAVKQ